MDKKEVLKTMIALLILIAMGYLIYSPFKKSSQAPQDPTVIYYNPRYSAYNSRDGKCWLNAVSVPSFTEATTSPLEKIVAEKEVRDCKARYLKWCEKFSPTEYEAFYRCESYRKELLEMK